MTHKPLKHLKRNQTHLNKISRHQRDETGNCIFKAESENVSEQKITNDKKTRPEMAGEGGERGGEEDDEVH